MENRLLHNLDYHNRRLNRSRFDLFGSRGEINLSDHIHIPNDLGSQTYKCRVVYKNEIERIEFEEYKPHAINRLIVMDADIDYAYKYHNRQEIDELKKNLNPGEDMLIVKDGFVTDSSMANICFWDGMHYYTPLKPLLKGTQRQYLIDQGELLEAEIHLQDIKGFKSFILINAMNELSPGRLLPIDRIIF
ncbi:aminotransferase class IV [Bacteroidota bacterium]